MFDFGDGDRHWGGWLAHLISTITTGLFALLAFLVTVGVLVLLVRFLLVGTKAAQLYIDQHKPQEPAPRDRPAPDPAPDAPTTGSAAPAYAPDGPEAAAPPSTEYVPPAPVPASGAVPVAEAAPPAGTVDGPDTAAPETTSAAEATPDPTKQLPTAETERLPRTWAPRAPRKPRTPPTE